MCPSRSAGRGRSRSRCRRWPDVYVRAGSIPPTGNYLAISDGYAYENAGTRKFTTPGRRADGTDDWVLVLDATGAAVRDDHDDGRNTRRPPCGVTGVTCDDGPGLDRGPSVIGRTRVTVRPRPSGRNRRAFILRGDVIARGSTRRADRETPTHERRAGRTVLGRRRRVRRGEARQRRRPGAAWAGPLAADELERRGSPVPDLLHASSVSPVSRR